MPDRRPAFPLKLLLGSLAVALFSFLYLYFVGSAVVLDETGGVESAVIINGAGHEQPLPRLWGGKYYAIPELEGTIEVRCRDGSRKRAGYVTAHAHTWISVVGERPCERLVTHYGW